MINIDEAIDYCIKFFKSIGISLDKNYVSEYYRANEPLYHDMFSKANSKYIAIELYEEKFKKELNNVQQDKIHNFYSQLK